MAQRLGNRARRTSFPWHDHTPHSNSPRPHHSSDRGGPHYRRTRDSGGIGDFLSPAFGTDCENHRIGAHATGATTSGSGTVSSNTGKLQLLSALNHCGGADMLAFQNGGPLSYADINQI
ncbi:hypothetical protein AB0C86_24760 [Streptomyces lavendulae]|uniref:hypothetical protein n=1 Tax=Streptomyces lavendulae TaxID=1914 RepID=UPI0033D812EC